MQVYELNTILDSRKSFYGKALIIEDSKFIKLQSYSTIVAHIEKSTDKLTIFGTYSNTTLRHIKEFIYQFTNLGSLNINDIRDIMEED